MAQTVQDRANEALARQGRGPCAAMYYANGGIFVSDNRHAIAPITVQDNHWRCWIEATVQEARELSAVLSAVL